VEGGGLRVDHDLHLSRPTVGDHPGYAMGPEQPETAGRGGMQGFKIQESEIIRGSQVRALLASVVRLLRVIVIAALTYGFLATAFRFFPWTREHSRRLLGYLINPLITLGQAVLSYLPKRFYILVIVVVLHFVLRFIRIIARELERGRIRIVGFYPEWVQPTAHRSMRATHLRTIPNEEITIPNSVVLGGFVTSLPAREPGVALHTSVTIGYDQPWRTIHMLLIDAALRTPDILHNPQPLVLQAQLEDSYVKYEISVYTNHPLRMPYIYSGPHANLQDSFFEAGVEIMSPIIHGLRDLNHVAMPDMYVPKDYRAKGFRVERTDLGRDGGGKGISLELVRAS